MTPIEAWSPPREFDEYRLIRRLARGRTGVVFLAQDTLLDRHVAIKFIPSVDDAVLARFLVEARAAARIQHPNVATLYRVGQLDGRPFLVSEFVRGESLDRIEKPIDPDSLLRIALALARGLAGAHRRGVLHRDIKPGNAILAESGEAVLLDFGLAKLARSAGEEVEPQVEASAAGGGPERLSAEDELALRDLTGGQLIGTPYFMAPEMWRREEATERSDLYSLGVLLYELAAGRGPFREVPLSELPRVVKETDPRPLRSAAPGVPERLAAIIDRCIDQSPEKRPPSADHLLAQLDALRPSRGGARVPDGNPYRGLRPFEPEHQALFFGRRSALAQALDRLRAEPFVLITGDSGVGKSSLCAAGLLPRVTEGGFEDGRSWAVARFFPGRAPVSAAAAALSPILGLEEEELEALLREQPTSLPRAVRRSLPERGGLLLYVDQLEELVTLAPAGEAEALSEALGAFIGGIPGLRLLATARSDFLSRLEALPALSERVSRALFLLAPLSSEEVREAIVSPAVAAKVHFEADALVDRLVESAAGADGAMPLLQFTLAELWERRDAGDVIREEALESLGGVSGALSRHADRILEGLRPAERAAARALLLRLVTAARTRTRRPEGELLALSPHARQVLDVLVRGRLLIATESADGPAYEIAHEALVVGWETLAGWLAEDSESRALVQRLEQAAAEWQRHDRPRELLWKERQLAEVKPGAHEMLTAREREFVDASRCAVRRVRWLRRAAVLAVLLVAGGVWEGTRLQARRELDREVGVEHEREVAVLQQARDLEGDLERERTEAFKAYDRGDFERGERLWKEVIALRGRVLSRYRDASEALERALLLDPHRRPLRHEYAGLLYERALLAERVHAGTVTEIVQRMLLHDDDGHLRAKWRAPATVDIDSEPSGAEVELFRYRVEEGRRVLKKGGRLGKTPIGDLEIEPGSLLFELSVKGRPAVRYPVLLERGEQRSLSVPILAAAEIPDGMIWIPPGRALFGSGDPEAVRAFFNAVPQHSIRIGGYLIARYETTFGDWIEYLESLPENERTRRTPRFGGSNVQAMRQLSLRRLGPKRWELSFQPGSVPLHAVSGQKIRYPKRSVFSEQDWLRFPVVGISAEDARAYTRWLDESGRVPGARLCTEKEWERAARGADDRTFPHGDVLAPRDANFDETYGKKLASFGLDEVGSHPQSRSPFGVDDMAGNAWEWVSSKLAGHAAARGGSYDFAASTVRISNRETPEPGYRDLSLGMRVCAPVTSNPP